MKRRHTALAGIATSALLLALVPATSATAGSTPAPPQGEPTGSLAKVDDKSHPLGDAQRALREAAVDKLVSGDAEVTTKNGKRVIELKAGKGKKGKGKHKNKYVQYDVNREANLFTILTDFGEETMPVQGGDPGPMHNEIAEPDRVWDGDATDNNSTMWRADFDREAILREIATASENRPRR